MKKALILIFISLSFVQYVNAQFSGHYWITEGHNRPNGWYSNIAIEQSWKHNNTKLGMGGEFAIVNAQNSFLNAVSFSAAQKFSIKEFKLSAFAAFQYRPFSEFIREKIFAFGLFRQTPHWNLKLGNFTRVYTLSKEMQELYPDDASNLKEWHNLLYDFEYLIMERESDFVVSIGLSNQSDFLYQQSTNFMIYGKVRKNILDHQVLFGEFRYQTAGSNNLQADYFGVIMKGGLLWNF